MFNSLQPTCNNEKFKYLERVLISFCFQPNSPVIICVYVECKLVIQYICLNQTVTHEMYNPYKGAAMFACNVA